MALALTRSLPIDIDLVQFEEADAGFVQRAHPVTLRMVLVDDRDFVEVLPRTRAAVDALDLVHRVLAARPACLINPREKSAELRAAFAVVGPVLVAPLAVGALQQFGRIELVP